MAAFPRTTTKGRTFPAEPLSTAEIRDILRRFRTGHATGVRNRALVIVLWRAGLRLSEALALMPKDVDRTGQALTVLRGKGGKRRVVGMDPEAFAVLERWLDRRAELKLDGRHRVFCTVVPDAQGKVGKPLTPEYVRNELRRAARDAGIDKRVHPHGLRHSMAAELVREGVPTPLVQRQLGHASLAVTQRYLESIAPEEVISAMRERPSWTEGRERADADTHVGKAAT
jgi:site-specific recombinase XerD